MVQIINKKAPEKKLGKAKKQLFAGGYGILLCVIVLVLLIVLNVLVSYLPSTMTKLDVSDFQFYQMSQQTIDIVGNVNEDMTIYLVAVKEAENVRLLEYLYRFSALNSHIKIETVDPVLFPGFTKNYTNDTLQQNSIIVVGEGRSSVIKYEDIFQFTQNAYASAESYTTFYGERLLTNAIHYIAYAKTPVIYLLRGHGEQDIPAYFKEQITQSNIEVRELTLLSEEIPEDASALCIITPAQDISEADMREIQTYLENSGKLLLITDYVDASKSNLLRLMDSYGMEMVDGIVVEGNTNFSLRGYAHYLLPRENSHAVTDLLLQEKRFVLMPTPQGLVSKALYRTTLDIQEILVTSSDAYAKRKGFQTDTYEREEDDIAGPFALGVAIQEAYDDIDTRIVWYSSGYLLNENADQIVSGGNMALVLSTLSWLCEMNGAISIGSKILYSEYLTMTSAQSSILSLMLTIILPAVILLVGLGVWLVRRRK